MATVDNKIVEMKFDKKDFEARVAETIKSLGALDKNIANTGTKNGLAGIGQAVEGVSAKFLALSAVGLTVLTNITNKAVDAGLRMANALTLQPITAGFQEYEQNMNSIQTILSNTQRAGTTLEDV